jgi:4-carboxymuconolactone decarboxylase
MSRSRTLVATAATFSLGLVAAQDRLPTLAPSDYTAEQKRAAVEFEAARNVPVFGPFETLMYSPQLMNSVRATGDYLRYQSAIGTTLSELAILVTAREWSQDYEWYVHRPIALKAGIRASIVDAIADGQRPRDLRPDEEIVYDFSVELHRNKQVSDGTFARAKQRFGERGVVDLAGICGYYSLLAMELNMARYRLPDEAKPLARFPK